MKLKKSCPGINKENKKYLQEQLFTEQLKNYSPKVCYVKFNIKSSSNNSSSNQCCQFSYYPTILAFFNIFAEQNRKYCSTYLAAFNIENFIQFSYFI